jgi:hypothetical protein
MPHPNTCPLAFNLKIVHVPCSKRSHHYYTNCTVDNDDMQRVVNLFNIWALFSHLIVAQLLIYAHSMDNLNLHMPRRQKFLQLNTSLKMAEKVCNM